MNQRDGIFKGGSLLIENVPVRVLRIDPDPALADAVSVVARFDDVKEFEALDIAEGAVVRVVGRREAAAGVSMPSFSVGGGIFVSGDMIGGKAFGARVASPTLELDVRVPPGFPLRLDVTLGAVEVGDVGGPIRLDVSGVADVRTGRTAQLDVRLSGAGKVVVSNAAKVGVVDVSGSGRVEVASVDGGKANLELSGTGSIDLASGTLDAVSVDVSGAGRVQVGATVQGDAEIEASGVARIVMARVLGRVRQETSGAARVSISN